MTPTPTPPCLGEREAVARTGEAAWASYAIARPKTAGTFRWRVPSRAVKDLTVSFLAENRTRGAGFDTVISPAFDHWNGYSVSVPNGTEWKPAEQPESKPRESYRCIEVEDLAAAEPCPFCQKIPTIDGNAPWMCAGPHEWHEWYLRCCGMVRAPTYRDPRLAVAAWNSALSPLRTENETLRARAEAAEKVLVGQTPDGSEYHTKDADGYRVDVPRCARFITEDRAGKHALIRKTILAKNAAEAERDAAIARAEDLERRADWLTDRRDLWLNEAQRLALLVRELGGTPEPSAVILSEASTFTAKLAQAEGEIATMRATAIEWRRARLAACAAPIGTPAVWTELGSAETALSEAIRALTTTEHPHGD